ncbi:hypothetical protein [Pseudorhodoferax sp.]|uniref:hypothetical protein n=1 Tax=Pseudorhodoferax sp. TaxID=1993553 RepID=UPI0039E439B9
MKSRTIIISDLHLGGGLADPGDDHVYQSGEFAAFIRMLAASPKGKARDLELYINGDFLEFAQAHQQGYQSKSTGFWCSEEESLEKLEVILSGHKDAFVALGELLDAGNALTIAAGNHDVDVYWPRVQERLRSATRPSVAFDCGEEWYSRYDDALQIGHGHIPDPANTFKRWANPVLRDKIGVARLEMCPGTLFMVKFVNGLEARYPFADNLHPVQRLAGLLAKEEKRGLFAASWALLKFAARHPKTMSIKSVDEYGQVLLAKVARSDNLAQSLLDAAGRVDPDRFADVAALRAHLRTEILVAEFILDYWTELEASGTAQKLEPGSDATLSAAMPKTLGKIKSSGDFGKDELLLVARNRASKVDKAQVIVMGHTHIPDDRDATHKVRYFNPGSWTRYVDLDRHPGISLDDLRAEDNFPYSLKYVVIDRGDDGKLTASLETFKEQPAKFS